MKKVDDILDIKKDEYTQKVENIENDIKEYDIFDDIKGVIRKLSTDIRNTYNLDDINPKIIDSYAKLAEVSIKYVELEYKKSNIEHTPQENKLQTAPLSLADMLDEIKKGG